MTKQYKWTNIILGLLVGILACVVYIATAEPTASWWDCGEYIATDYKLLVGHPPGAPTFQLFGRVASLFAGGDVTKVAFCINCLSAICSGLTIMFLVWTITMLGRKLVAKSGEMTTGRMLAVFGSALVGSLAYTFTDTFWFSAVEGEVYAMSSFFTALVFWCILKWDFEYDNPKPGANPHRWIILIAYLIGLSIGVHLLNLLTIPAVVLIVYFKLCKNAGVWGVLLTIDVVAAIAAIFFPPLAMFAIWLLVCAPLTYYCVKNEAFKSWANWGVLFSLVGSFILLGLVLYFIIPNVVNFAGIFERIVVNNLHLPFNSGAIIFFVLLAGLVAGGLYWGYKRKSNLILAAFYSFFFLLVGYSTFFVLVIRSNANPTIDENNPEDAVALLAYLNREQYGDTPVLTGRTYNSQVVNSKPDGKVYVRDTVSKSYIATQTKYKQIYDRTVFMPRMYDHQEDHPENYVRWVAGDDAKKQAKMLRKGPSYSDNITFMHKYQFNYMYFRYFMWNFSGRQNDIQGRGDEVNGNWITGIPFIDNARLGDQPKDVASLKNKGNNKYYMLPLLLGLVGLVFYSVRDTKNSFVVLMLFLMTGLAIAFYLNMYAYQPRERDYAFAASFYAFCIWIGFGVYAIYSLFEKMKSKLVQILAPALVTLLCLLLVPGVLAKENWDDHDRSHRYTALAAAKAYLDSCAPNAILFTMGDNDTFPIWYAQEVEGYRTDVRNCNLSLLSAGWYVDQMKRKAYESEPLPIDFTWEQYRDGTRDYILVKNDDSNPIALKDFMKEVRNADNDKVDLSEKAGKSFYIDVDRRKVIDNGTVTGPDTANIVDRMVFTFPAQPHPNNKDIGVIHRNAWVVLEMIATSDWDRPLYFASSTLESFGLEKYLQNEGLAYRLVPVEKGCHSNTEILYDNVMHKFDDHTRPDVLKNPDAMKGHTPYEYAWGGINDPRVYNSEDNVRLALSISTMHTRLAKDLVNEYNLYIDAWEKQDKADEAAKAAESNLYKLQRAKEVLDHLQMVLPDDIMPYLNQRYQQYTLSFLEAAQTYQDISAAYETASEKYSSIKGEFDGKQAEEAGQKLRSIFLRHVVQNLNFIENSKYRDRVRKAYAEDIKLIYNILPELSSCSNEELSKLPASDQLNPYYEETKKMIESLEMGMSSCGKQFDEYDNLYFQNVSDDGKRVWLLPEEDSRVADRINTVISNFDDAYKLIHKKDPRSLDFESLLVTLSKTKLSVAAEATKLLERYNRMKPVVDEYWERARQVEVKSVRSQEVQNQPNTDASAQPPQTPSPSPTTLSNPNSLPTI